MTTRRNCPNCDVTLTRYEWSRLWWMSSVLTGRLVQPCKECGSLIRLSALTLLSGVGAVGLTITAGLLFKWPSIWLLAMALIFSILILVGVMGSRLETVPPANVQTAAPPRGKADDI